MILCCCLGCGVALLCDMCVALIDCVAFCVVMFGVWCVVLLFVASYAIGVVGFVCV